MEIADIAEVKVLFERNKYLLVKVSAPDGSEKFIVRTGPDPGLHKQIWRNIIQELSGFKVRRFGGGSLFVDEQSKHIKISDFSGDYGLADHNKTAKILAQQECFREYSIETHFPKDLKVVQ